MPVSDVAQFTTVAEVNAYHASIPPLDITAELQACGDDGLAMAKVAICSLAAYISKYCAPMDLPAQPPRRRKWRQR